METTKITPEHREVWAIWRKLFVVDVIDVDDTYSGEHEGLPYRLTVAFDAAGKIPGYETTYLDGGYIYFNDADIFRWGGGPGEWLDQCLGADHNGQPIVDTWYQSHDIDWINCLPETQLLRFADWLMGYDPDVGLC
jgi:hypothetical protein